jgi:hypothetical protein
MRLLIAGAVLVMMMTSAAIADDDDAKDAARDTTQNAAQDAQKLAMRSRDDYWRCLAREYSRDANQGLSEQDFTRSVAGACPSERQYYRVALLDYLTTQYPNIDAGAHLATANRAVESAQKDIVTAFVKHRDPQKR